MISSSFAMWSSFAVASSSKDSIKNAKVSSSSDEDSLEGSWSGSSASSSTSSDEEDMIIVASSSTSILPSDPSATTLKRRRSKITVPLVPSLPTWTTKNLNANLHQYTALRKSQGHKRPIVLLLENHLVDVGDYGRDHPGGLSLMVKFSLKSIPLLEGSEGVAKGENWSELELKDCTPEFNGGLNDHGWSAIQKMKEMRIAKLDIV